MKAEKINRIKYTGERVVPNMMRKDVINWKLHLYRYIYILKYVVNKKVLDAACGTGYGMSLISSVARKVEGIDIDAKTIEWAKKNNHFYCQTKFEIKDLEKEKIEGKYNCIVSFETIEHLKRPDLFLNTSWKSLTKKGLFIFSIPINEPKNPLHERSYSWKEIEELIKNNTNAKKIQWLSQYRNCIKKGKKSKALFAIGIVYKSIPPIQKRIERKIRIAGHFLKAKIKERLSLTNPSRW